MVAKDASSAKRLPFVTRRVRLLQELRERGIVDVLSVPGKENPEFTEQVQNHLLLSRLTCPGDTRCQQLRRVTQSCKCSCFRGQPWSCGELVWSSLFCMLVTSYKLYTTVRCGNYM